MITFFVYRLGSRVAFGLYGLLSAAFFGLFVHVNYYHKEEGYKFEEENVEQVVINDSSALAPHGVPTNPIARSVSRQNVDSNASTSETQPIGRQNNLSAQYASTTNTNDQYGTYDPDAAWN